MTAKMVTTKLPNTSVERMVTSPRVPVSPGSSGSM